MQNQFSIQAVVVVQENNIFSINAEAKETKANIEPVFFWLPCYCKNAAPAKRLEYAMNHKLMMTFLVLINLDILIRGGGGDHSNAKWRKNELSWIFWVAVATNVERQRPLLNEFILKLFLLLLLYKAITPLFLSNKQHYIV